MSDIFSENPGFLYGNVWCDAHLLIMTTPSLETEPVEVLMAKRP